MKSGAQFCGFFVDLCVFSKLFIDYPLLMKREQVKPARENPGYAPNQSISQIRSDSKVIYTRKKYLN